jgi:soluble lytic murein transglycosylase-like protein
MNICKILTFIIIMFFTIINLSISSEPPSFDELVINNIYKSIIHLNPDINIEEARKISNSILFHANKYTIPWTVLVAVINTESEFKKDVKFNGCYGLMQINISAHYKNMADMKYNKWMLFHIDNNINLGCKILKDYIEDSKTINTALKKYSGGSNRYVKKVNKTLSRIIKPT